MKYLKSIRNIFLLSCFLIGLYSQAQTQQEQQMPTEESSQLNQDQFDPELFWHEASFAELREILCSAQAEFTVEEDGLTTANVTALREFVNNLTETKQNIYFISSNFNCLFTEADLIEADLSEADVYNDLGNVDLTREIGFLKAKSNIEYNKVKQVERDDLTTFLPEAILIGGLLAGSSVIGASIVDDILLWGGLGAAGTTFVSKGMIVATVAILGGTVIASGIIVATAFGVFIIVSRTENLAIDYTDQTLYP